MGFKETLELKSLNFSKNLFMLFEFELYFLKEILFKISQITNFHIIYILYYNIF